MKVINPEVAALSVSSPDFTGFMARLIIPGKETESIIAPTLDELNWLVRWSEGYRHGETKIFLYKTRYDPELGHYPGPLIQRDAKLMTGDYQDAFADLPAWAKELPA